LTATDMLAHLLKYDSAHGRFDGTVSHTENSLIVNGKEITVTHSAILKPFHGARSVLRL
jgi:glyceraldehyde 3-phosphate dehydrogenase